jgi:cell division protein ZapE
LSQDVVSVYEQSLKRRGFVSDSSQWRAVERLQQLHEEWSEYKKRRSSALKRLLVKPPLPKGVYLWGPVGRGKSFLMDAFYLCVPLVRKRRVHFHHFMREIHRELDQLKGTEDPIAAVAERTAKRYRLICFDEFHVSDIADAMILGRLFKGLFENDVVVVATSNVHPRDLYRNGLNRQLFLPFIDLLEQHMEIEELKAVKDFRLEKLSGKPLYFTPADATARAEMDKLWAELTGKSPGAPLVLEVKGRKLTVPKAALGVARFGFDELCAQPLGTIDFLAIAHAFHTVFIDGIPDFSDVRRDVVRRFINLIDTLYDNRVGLVVSAAAEPDALSTEREMKFLFERTASRLTEMRSETYLAARSDRLAAPEPAA